MSAVKLMTISQKNHYISVFTNAVKHAESTESIPRGFPVEQVMEAYFEALNQKQTRPRAVRAKKAPMTEEEKAAKAEAKAAEKAAKAAAKALKDAEKAAEKKEWMTPVRFSAEAEDGSIKQFKGTNGSFLRIQRHRTSGIVRKKVENNWTPEANDAFEKEYGTQEPIDTPTNVLAEVVIANEKPVVVEEPMVETTEESKTQSENDTKKAKLLALSKAKKEAAAKEAAEKKAAEEKAAKEAAAKEVAQETTEVVESDELDAEEFEVVEDANEHETFTDETFPGLTLWKDESGMIYNIEGDELVGMYEQDGSVIQC